MIKDKILVEKELKIIKDSLKGCIGNIEEIQEYIKYMEFKSRRLGNE